MVGSHERTSVCGLNPAEIDDERVPDYERG